MDYNQIYQIFMWFFIAFFVLSIVGFSMRFIFDTINIVRDERYKQIKEHVKKIEEIMRGKGWLI